MDYKKVLEELYNLDVPKWTLGLDRIEALLKGLNNPEKSLKCIHVAGTNGKGSTCAMISSILVDAGYKVGMYTSPHLKRFNERIRINNRLISDKDIVKYYLKVKRKVSNQSFFEITTAMAFLYFKDKKLDFTVLETGLGGRLDATNVVMPLISVITNIGLDHTKYLGKTIEKIAKEKAGIIKNNVPVITAAEGIALETIKDIANKKNSKLIIANTKKIKFNKEKFNNLKNNNNAKTNEKLINASSSKVNSYRAFDFNGYKNIELKHLDGQFQALNAAIAIKAIETIKNNFKIDKKKIINGLKSAKWPGRFQFINKNVLVDSAHNPQGFKLLFNEIKNIYYKNLILIIGFSDDKDIKKISKTVKADKIIITKSGNERAIEPKTIKKYFKTSIIKNNPKEALNYAKSMAKKDDLILITGSIFLVGELT